MASKKKRTKDELIADLQAQIARASGIKDIEVHVHLPGPDTTRETIAACSPFCQKFRITPVPKRKIT